MIIIRRQRDYSRKKPTVYLLVGLPGSGKSTWCKKVHPDLPIVSRDVIRAELKFTKNVHEKARLEDWQEEKVNQKETEYIKNYLRRGEDFIIDDTNLKEKYRKPLLDTLYRGGAYVVGVNFRTPLSICIKRRRYQIDPEIMKNIYETMDKIEEYEVDKLINVN